MPLEGNSKEQDNKVNSSEQVNFPICGLGREWHGGIMEESRAHFSL